MKNRDRLYSADSFVVAEIFVLRTNPDSNRDAEKTALRQSSKRQVQVDIDTKIIAWFERTSNFFKFAL
jgi:hypothetical protein